MSAAVTPNLPGLAAAFDLTDADIEQAAERAAERVQRLSKTWQSSGVPAGQVMRHLRRIAHKHHVELPSAAGLTQWLNRMGDPVWWRRALRKRLRTVEHHAIQSGRVHKRASPYVSTDSLKRFDADRRRLRTLLESLELVNLDSGELIALADVVASSQANPANRRMAMMARIKGVESRSNSLGHEALFLTITAPSRMHARHHTGQANAQHDGSSPRQVQCYLSGVWRKAMRAIQRDGLACYGVRVVEPHHDGCPHWHVLMFTTPEHSLAILSIFRKYALADSPDEPGAAEHRFKVERIDPSKGSATGYVAKYVSKSIDGEGLDSDTESDTTGGDTARHVIAWARRWGIRQFQFFGLPPITPMRELYRCPGDALTSEGLTVAHQACKANDYAAFLAACERNDLGFAVQYDERPSTRYADEIARVIRGLSVTAADLSAPVELTTRTEKWCIQPRRPPPSADGLCLPWTRFNNCADPSGSTTCAPSAHHLHCATARSESKGVTC
jgi:hypothetical protein